MTVLTTSVVIPAENKQQEDAIKKALNQKNHVSEETLNAMRSLSKIQNLTNDSKQGRFRLSEIKA